MASLSDAKAVDSDYVEGVIQRVDRASTGFWVTHDSSADPIPEISDGTVTIWIPDAGVTPQEGDTVRVYGRYETRGVDINGGELYYHADNQQQDAARYDFWEDVEAVLLEEFARQRDGFDTRYLKLPLCLQHEMDQVRSRELLERASSEADTLTICEAAVTIATALQNPARIRQYERRDPETRNLRIFGLANLSGAAMGEATRLAKLHVEAICTELAVPGHTGAGIG